jgi:hypothetical protein
VPDNLGAHKSAKVVARIWAAGARVLYLPAYSPNLKTVVRHISRFSPER